MHSKLPFRYDHRTMDPAAGPVDPVQEQRLGLALAEQAEVVGRLRRQVDKIRRLLSRRDDSPRSD